MGATSRSSIAALLAYVAVSCAYFGARLLPHPGRKLVGFGADPQIFAWAFAWWPHALLHGHDPFAANVLWAPDGVDLAWTATTPGLALAFASVTLLAGPIVAYNLAAVAMPALAAWTAYLLCRHVSGALWPSVVGGYVFGFSGYMLGQELGHVHMTAVFLVPLVALVVLRFVEGSLGGRGLAWRLGVLLGGQLWLSTELFLTASVALAVALALAWWLVRATRPRLRALLRPLAAGYGLALLLASPLVVRALAHFETISINRPKDFDADLLNFAVPTRLVAAGAVWAPPLAARFDGNDAERGAYLGLPVLAIVVLFALAARRRPGGRFLLAALGLAAFAALGTSLRVGGVRIAPLPWKLVAHVPPFTNVLPVRLTLFAALAAAVIVALWLASAPRRWALALGALAVLALVPRVSLPVWSTTPERPSFFADGTYRKCLRPDEIVFAVPFEGNGSSMLWQADADFAFRLAGGYVRPGPPWSYLRYPAVWNLHFTGDPPAPADLATLARDKGITRFVVTEAADAQWRPVLQQFGEPTRIGGVVVYPGCGA